MQDSDLLQTIAEIAIALTGFTGVVAFLGNRARGEWRAVDLFRFNNLLSSSIAALLFSFTPVLFFKLGVPESAAWRWSSGLMAGYLLIAAFLSIRGLRRVPEQQQVEIDRLVLGVLFSLILAVVVLLVSNAIGFAYPGESGPLIVGLVYLLAFSAFQFVRLLQLLKINDEDAV